VPHFLQLFFALQISIDKLEKCSVELVKHIFNSDSEALNARILLCIFWSLLRVQSSYIKQDSMVCNCKTIQTSPILISLLGVCHALGPTYYTRRLAVVKIECFVICFSSSSHHRAKISFRSTCSISLSTAQEHHFNLSRSSFWMKVCYVTLQEQSMLDENSCLLFSCFSVMLLPKIYIVIQLYCHPALFSVGLFFQLFQSFDLFFLICWFY
jgi:hypothetical protein